MKSKSTNLFIEINNSNFIFAVGLNEEDNKFQLLHVNSVPIQGITDNRISDYDLICKIFKKNIYDIEQKFQTVFKDVIIIIDNFDCSINNYSGFKKLNGTQLVKDNITYILNVLKSKINEFENEKTILHIFNTKFLLDNKQIDNLPIGLFGNFYSHELSFFLINSNNLKNLENTIKECNLKIKKILSKNFIEGVGLIDKNPSLESFFKIQINKNFSQVLFFEKSAIKFIQNFNFGTNIIINDIAKVTALKVEIIEKIIHNLNFSEKQFTNEILEKEFFEENNFRKIEKKLILDIASARIEELSEILLMKNINVSTFKKQKNPIFLFIDDKLSKKSFLEVFKIFFSNKSEFELNIEDENEIGKNFEQVNKVVQYGWKKEAIPVIQEKKSIISRLFNLIFN